ncbi:hypothetical protein B0H16DRAFT_166659 [Mycena metata]|uniref:F-box domain-containing protein n=1 Tax=Mycena metata TaxID=1033252 RepID=A0AAD7JUV0_9AGAR|nr:hypothetical protein B0H16DRAFT_166659 [Mycena metata]
MHPALGILELVEMVCYNLGPHCHRAYGTLAALALTCRSLRDPALDALWNRQESLIPILLCMPADVFNVRPDLYSATPLRVVRPLAPSDWKRLSLYSHRVRTLDTSFEYELKEIYPILNLCLSSVVLFPNLRNLCWYSESDEEFLCIRIFLTATLSRLDLAYEPSTTTCSLLSTLGRTCPHLTDLEITLPASKIESDLNCTAMSGFLCSMPRIESVTVPMLQWSAVKHIGQFHTLNSLSLVTLPNVPLAVPPPAPFIFAGPRQLQLGFAYLPEILHLLQMGSHIKLESLTLEFAVEYTAEESAKLYTALTVACSPNSLTYLHLGLVARNGAASAECAITDELLRILFCFTKLTSLQLTSAAIFTIHDGTMMDAAQAWPCLEDLVLDSYHRPLTPPLLTLESLYSLAQHCPRLRFLRLRLDATSLPTARPLSNALAPQRELTSMRIAQSAISQPRAIARLLSDIFPNVRTISRAQYLGEPPAGMDANYDRWKEVEGLIPEFVAVREEERARAQLT